LSRPLAVQMAFKHADITGEIHGLDEAPRKGYIGAIFGNLAVLGHAEWKRRILYILCRSIFEAGAFAIAGGAVGMLYEFSQFVFGHFGCFCRRVLLEPRDCRSRNQSPKGGAGWRTRIQTISFIVFSARKIVAP